MTSRIMTAQLHHLVFLVNRETHLPLSGRVIGTERTVVKSIEFSYPQNGPDSIFSLGVPQETPVIIPSRSARLWLGSNSRAPPSMVEKLVVAGGPESPAAQPTADPAPIAPQENAIPKCPMSGLRQFFLWKDRLVRSSPSCLFPHHCRITSSLNGLNLLMANCWKAQGITPAQPATDSEFLRRVYLDLTGRIPTVSEVYAFLDDPREDRREQLVEDLLHRRDHATHLAAVWRSILLPDGVDLNTYGGTNKFDSWLADRFGQNMPYDEIVRQLLSG